MTGRLILIWTLLLPILAQATVIGAEDIALLRAGVVKITAKPPGGSPKVGTGFIVRIPLQSIADDVAKDRFKAKPSRVFKFEDIREAHRVMEANEANGKVVVVHDRAA